MMSELITKTAPLYTKSTTLILLEMTLSTRKKWNVLESPSTYSECVNILLLFCSYRSVWWCDVPVHLTHHFSGAIFLFCNCYSGGETKTE